MSHNNPNQSKQHAIESLKSLISLMSSEKNKVLVRSLFDEPCGIPVSIFNAQLSPLEAVVKYLIENKGVTVKIASALLNRSPSSLYTTYTIAKKKMTEMFKLGQKDHASSSQNIVVPYTLFEDRDHSILETLVAYLRTEKCLKLSEIALILGKSYSTIKTVSWRHAKKDEE